jgi:adenylate cyclase
MSNVKTVVDWLADGARSAVKSEDVLVELCQRMISGGIPLWRAAVFVNTLHPEVVGRSFIWQTDTGVKVSEARYDMLETDEYVNSPVMAIYNTHQPLRRRLADDNCLDDFPVLADLRVAGATDYVAFPLPFTDGSVHVATWTTRQDGGFTPKQFSDIESIVAPLTRVAEIRALRRTASNLLNTYVGRQAGERILAGKIRRGHVEAIRAAIWLSDMRGSTSLAEQLPPQALVDLLNRYFDCQVPVIFDHGGEVLKFIGDGLLAIFPIGEDDRDAAAICRRAASCAREVCTRINTLAVPEGVIGTGAIRFGVALHLGEVMYGNIGSGDRLDFTCIGPAVNLAARLESVVAKLGKTIVASAEFASHVPEEFTPLGEFNVVGFSSSQTVFGLRN